jgi:hypothetical protein
MRKVLLFDSRAVNGQCNLRGYVMKKSILLLVAVPVLICALACGCGQPAKVTGLDGKEYMPKQYKAKIQGLYSEYKTVRATWLDVGNRFPREATAQELSDSRAKFLAAAKSLLAFAPVESASSKTTRKLDNVELTDRYVNENTVDTSTVELILNTPDNKLATEVDTLTKDQE